MRKPVSVKWERHAVVGESQSKVVFMLYRIQNLFVRKLARDFQVLSEISMAEKSSKHFFL